MNPVTPDPHTKCARCQCTRDWHRNGPCSAKDEFGLCCHDRGCPGFVEPVLHIRSIVSNGSARRHQRTARIESFVLRKKWVAIELLDIPERATLLGDIWRFLLGREQNGCLTGALQRL